MPRHRATDRALPGEAGETLASRAFLRLRQDIIEGSFTAGEKLRIRQLCETFGIGVSPMREALNRLSRDGLVEQTDLRGFSVAAVSEEDLVELTRARLWMNEVALRQSIARGDSAWEESVVLAYYRMSRITAAPASRDPAWEVAHRGFHTSLIAACGSRWMIRACEQLFDAADRYRYLSRAAHFAEGRRQDEHRPMMEAAIAREVETAVRLLQEHFLRTEERSCNELRRRAAAASSLARPHERVKAAAPRSIRALPS